MSTKEQELAKKPMRELSVEEQKKRRKQRRDQIGKELVDNLNKRVLEDNPD